MPASLFRDSAAAHPTRTALVWDGGEWTYSQLLAAVDALRRALGPSLPEFVGILAHKSPTAYAAVQAILSQGRTYVPLNPSFPAGRNAYIATRTRLDTLVVDDGCARALEALLSENDSRYRIVALGDASEIEKLARSRPDRLALVLAHPDPAIPSQPLAAPPEKDTCAYVLFTSGSTGTPKGVRVGRANVLSYVRSLLELYPIEGEDRLSQTFDLTFDLSVHDQFVCWAAGATLVVFPDRVMLSPLQWAQEHRVSVWFSVPSLAAFLESARLVVPGALPGLRLSLFCGEKLTWNTCQIWRSIAPNSRVANLYGPTEATIAISHFEVGPDFAESDAFQGGIPIGRAFPGQRLQVRRETGEPCPVGETGELWLGGDQIAPGYLGDPEKTAERFVPGEDCTWYRTGDLVFEDGSGVVHYVGRTDFQVKVMGYRIELGEIEHALMRAAGCTFAVADVGRIRNGIEEIFCVLPAACASAKATLKKRIKTILPAYMVPRHYVFTDDIPLNANGKIDRPLIRRRIEDSHRD